MTDLRAPVGLVIVEYQDPGGAESIVRAMRDSPDVETVVVSTGPEPFTTSRGPVQVIHLPQNPGFGAALNEGVRALPPGVLHFAVSNTDVHCSLEHLRRLRAEAQRSGIAAIAPVIVGPEGRVEWDGGSIDFLRVKIIHEHLGDAPRADGIVVPTTFLTGAFALFRRDVWESVGGMREDYFLYGEDADLSMRLLRAGWAAAVYSGVQVVHQPSRSVGRYSALQMYLMARNNIRFFREWSPGRWGRLMCWPVVPLRLAWQALNRGRERTKLLRWLAMGTWDARRSSPHLEHQGRGTALLAARARTK